MRDVALRWYLLGAVYFNVAWVVTGASLAHILGTGVALATLWSVPRIRGAALMWFVLALIVAPWVAWALEGM